MKSEHIKEILVEYHEGSLDKKQRREVENHLEQCGECRLELEQYELLDNLFKEEKEIKPSERLEAGFSAMLERERQVVPENRYAFSYKKIFQVAAAIAVLFLSFQAGRFMEQKPTEAVVVANENSAESSERIAMLSLMTDESASKRIQGVNYFEEYQDLDEDILRVLINKMLYDENKNVRLTAVEALAKFSTSQEVKQNLLTALKTEKDPVIQISLIQTLVKLQEKKAVEPMKQLLRNEETEPFVKDQIKALLPSIV